MTARAGDPAATRVGVGRFAVVVSCEHADREVPDAYAELFASDQARAALESHRGWDPGALDVAEGFAAELGAPLVPHLVTRLLVECNRSMGHPGLWSEFSRSLPRERREELLERIWRPHRDAVRRLVGSATASGRASARGEGVGPASPCVVHVGVHTFTPVWGGRRRATDIGILYDPRREREARVAGLWRDALTSGSVGRTSGAAAAMKVHLNRPYRGWTDGLTTSFRAEFPPTRYLGFELEVSQALVPVDPWIVTLLAESLLEALRRASFG